MSRPRTVALLVALAASSVALPAFAKSDAFKLGVGLGGVIGGNFLDKPSDKTLVMPNGQSVQGSDFYPGFAGMTAGGGLMIDARFISLLGVELDVFRTSDKGSGDLTLHSGPSSVKVHMTLGQSAWHVPVLVKLAIPAPIVSPVVFVGPEFVFPGSPTFKADPALAQEIKASADQYTMIAFGAGVEIKLPLPAIDLRIPVQLRGGYNPGVSSKLADRITTDSSFQLKTIKSEWKFQAVATLGAELYF